MSQEGKASQTSTSVFNELRLKGQFCDAVIKAEDTEFPVHKVILCDCSLYFRALFERWSDPDRKVFDIPGVSPDMMQLIIEFAYSRSVTVTKENVQDLLLVADQLNVLDIVQICFNFLGEHVCVKNCIGIWQFTKICYSADLQRKAYHYILDHFEDVFVCEEFQQLSVQELSDIIEKDNLNVRRESTVFEAVLHWIGHATEERNQHIAMLLSKVRLSQTSVEYITFNVMSNALVNKNTACKTIVANAMQVMDEVSPDRSAVSSYRNLVDHPRLPNAVLLATGGWSGGDPTNSIEAYDFQTNRWVNITNQLEHPRAYHGAVFLSGSVYFVGGFDRMEHFNSMRRLDLSSHTWYGAAPMHYRRCYVSVTVLNGCIYALGGYDGHARLNTAEVYIPESNQWNLIASMHEHRSDASCTTLHDKVYICGGFNGTECLQTAEYYSPETNQWTVITPMSMRRSGVAVITYANHIYAVGGFDGNNRLRSAEAYNPLTNTWHTVASMLTTRSNFGIEVIDDRIFAVGGFNGFTTTYNVESYDSTTNEWSEACDMELFRSALSCCVVSGVSNLARYSPCNTLSLLYREDGEEYST